MTKYNIEISELGSTIISRLDENEKIWYIPTDPTNSDYQEYLKWVEENKGEKC